MYEQFTDRARKVLQLAKLEAIQLRHEYMGCEHILLGLLKDGGGVAANVLKNLGVDLDVSRLGIIPGVAKVVPEGPMPQTPRAKRVVEHAAREARLLGHNYVGTEHLLLGLIWDAGLAGDLLKAQGVTVEKVREEVVALVGTPKKEDPTTPVETVTRILVAMKMMQKEEGQKALSWLDEVQGSYHPVPSVMGASAFSAGIDEVEDDAVDEGFRQKVIGILREELEILKAASRTDAACAMLKAIRRVEQL